MGFWLQLVSTVTDMMVGKDKLNKSLNVIIATMSMPRNINQILGFL